MILLFGYVTQKGIGKQLKKVRQMSQKDVLPTSYRKNRKKYIYGNKTQDATS